MYAQKVVGKQSESRQGNLFIYWGWNWESYTNSNIHFTGTDYDFTLQNVMADDRQSNIGFDTYLNPSKATVPQYNFRIGYYFKRNYSISFGIDHMKYVVRQNQVVKIDGHINDVKTGYTGNYGGVDIILKPDFLKLEHTDGLNFINLDVRRFNELYSYGAITISGTSGIGAGILIPRTDATLLGKPRHDKFHVSGFGVSVMAGLNIKFWNHFFIQTEVKGGYITLPDVRTTSDVKDGAKQSFLFGQYNIVFGTNILLNL
ncbi:MAG: hypothetical protein IPO92_10160 [Saprospiraceae bacterium]|nr:hypothetical protein [Saprospiraceae bacterium]